MSSFEEKINALLRPNIRALKPYSSARDEFKDSSPPLTLHPPLAAFPPPPSTFLFLDANENSLGSPSSDDYSRYPTSQQMLLKAAIGALKDIPPSQIFLGNGSDEAIDLLLRAFCEPGRDNVILMPPTYGMYAVQADIHGTEQRQAPLRPDFSPDAQAVKAATNEASKLLFLCSPNNPTGNCLPETFILEMLRDFPGLVVLDEAYMDFSTMPSWVSRLPQFPHLVVLQTFSKAWGMAGARVGMAFAHPLIISVLNKIKYPYNLSTANIRLAEEAIKNKAIVKRNIGALLAERARLEKELPKLACVKKVFPSDANFLLVRMADADAAYRFLVENGIVVRNRGKEPRCENCLRITVGTPEENTRLLHTLDKYTPL